jgi:hypothetical protein
VCNSLLAGNLEGNFLKKGPKGTILTSKAWAASNGYGQITCSTEHGIFIDRAGKFIEGAGNGNVALGGRADPTLWLERDTALIGGQRIIEGGAVRERERESRAVAVTAGHIDRTLWSKKCR